jgi:signal transduction histidine kinase
MIPRKYFSGGMSLLRLDAAMRMDGKGDEVKENQHWSPDLVDCEFDPVIWGEGSLADREWITDRLEFFEDILQELYVVQLNWNSAVETLGITNENISKFLERLNDIRQFCEEGMNEIRKTRKSVAEREIFFESEKEVILDEIQSLRILFGKYRYDFDDLFSQNEKASSKYDDFKDILEIFIAQEFGEENRTFAKESLEQANMLLPERDFLHILMHELLGLKVNLKVFGGTSEEVQGFTIKIIELEEICMQSRLRIDNLKKSFEDRVRSALIDHRFLLEKIENLKDLFEMHKHVFESVIPHDRYVVIEYVLRQLFAFLNKKESLEEFDLRKTIHAIYEIQKDPNIVFSFTEDTPEKLNIVQYKRKLYEALYNIIKNGIEAINKFKHEKKSGIPFQGTMKIHLITLRDKITIVIETNGGAIPAHIRDSILKDNLPVATATKKYGEYVMPGGLGLISVHNVVTNTFHGQMEIVTHEENVGTPEESGSTSIVITFRRMDNHIAVNHAMQAVLPAPTTLWNTGGIDLSLAGMKLRTENKGGKIIFHFDPLLLQRLQRASGFFPLIINIQPLINLRKFLGLGI